MSAFPTSVKPSHISITSFTPNLVSVTHSLKRQVRQRGGQRWMLDVTFASMSQAEFAPLWAFANEMQGQFKTFTFRPGYYLDDISTSQTIYVNSTTTVAGQDWVVFDNSSAAINAGTYIKFGNHDKAYIVTKDAAINDTYIYFTPPLLEDVDDNALIYIGTVDFTVAFNGDIQKMSVSTDGRTTWGMALVEVV